MAKYKVLVLGSENDPLELEREELSNVDCELVQTKPSSEGEAMEAVRDADAILMRGPWGTEQVINATQHCQVLAVYSHGFNHIDVDACTEKGIILTNSAGMCAEEVSDQAAAFLLALNRSVVNTTEEVRTGKWDRTAYTPIYPLEGATLGIVGFGNIGRRVARKMAGWRMNTIVFDPYIPPWVTHEYGVEHLSDLNELFSRSDYVVVVVPLNKETRHMIGREQFGRMKDTAYFINVCRGPVVDEPALIEALQQGKIRGAGLDVFEQEPVDPNNPLLKMKNVIVAPHIAGTSVRSAVLSRKRAAAQVAAVLHGEWPQAGQNPEVRSKIAMRSNARWA